FCPVLRICHLGILRGNRSPGLDGRSFAGGRANLPSSVARGITMNGLGFRQTNAWLHTWTGLLLGWLLYAVFVTGTVSFFRDEINYWMKPELHVSQPDAETAQRTAKAMQRIAPDASSWTITLPDERNTAVSVQWFDGDAPQGKSRGKRLLLDAATAEPLAPRDTRGADFLYRFH